MPMQNTEPTTPYDVLSLKHLLNNYTYHAIRMINVDSVENASEQGDMLWPEFLICASENSAKKLCNHLNYLSYLESRSIWIEEEPYLEEEELKQRWKEDGIGIYEVILVQNLNTHPDAYRLSESLIALERVKEDKHLKNFTESCTVHLIRPPMR